MCRGKIVERTAQHQIGIAFHEARDRAGGGFGAQQHRARPRLDAGRGPQRDRRRLPVLRLHRTRRPDTIIGLGQHGQQIGLRCGQADLDDGAGHRLDRLDHVGQCMIRAVAALANRCFQPPRNLARLNAGIAVDPEDIIEPVFQDRPARRSARNDLPVMIQPHQSGGGRIGHQCRGRGERQCIVGRGVQARADDVGRDDLVVFAMMAAAEQRQGADQTEKGGSAHCGPYSGIALKRKAGGRLLGRPPFGPDSAGKGGNPASDQDRAAAPSGGTKALRQLVSSR